MTKTVKTFTATIYVGTKVRYDGKILSPKIADRLLQSVADRGGLCVTVTPLKFIYKNGGEPGIAVGLINYPRFPESSASIRRKALGLAEELRKAYKQMKVCVVFPDRTVMLCDERLWSEFRNSV